MSHKTTPFIVLRQFVRGEDSTKEIGHREKDLLLALLHMQSTKMDTSSTVLLAACDCIWLLACLLFCNDEEAALNLQSYVYKLEIILLHHEDDYSCLV